MMYSATQEEGSSSGKLQDWEVEKAKARRKFLGFFTLFQVIAVIIIGLVFSWLIVFAGGIAWTKAKLFNLHPLFMVLGFIICYGEAILLYRAVHFLNKYPVKVMHTVVQLLSLIFAALGLAAIVIANWKSRHFYSIHGWLGLTTIILFVLQWVAGLAVFLLPCASGDLRRSMLPVHTAMGLAIFVMAGVNALLGITEMNMGKKGYDYLHPYHKVGNALAVFVAFFVGLAAFMLVKSEWKRPPDELLRN